jgi:hypothetical protein
LSAVRSKGLVVPNVQSAAHGAFSVPGSEQDLYLVSVGECGARHVDNWGTVRLAVVEGRKLVAQAELPGGTSISGLFDIDRDGRVELVLTISDTNQGDVEASASLARFERGSLQVLADFGQVYIDRCAHFFLNKDPPTYKVVSCGALASGKVECSTMEKTGSCP